MPINVKNNAFLKFLAFFLAVGFLMKIVSEIVHEVFGHGFFALLFGGRITGVHISLLWPYESSYIQCDLPSLSFWQIVMFIGGGILVCLIVSFAFQAFLLFKKLRWWLDSTLFWFAFWCFINPTGYLIIGGIMPFGDVIELINLGVLTSPTAIAVGTLLFLIEFFVLSKILKSTLMELFSRRRAGLGVVLFWFVVPFLTVLYMIGQARLLIGYLPISFLPVVASFLMYWFGKAKT